MKPISQIKRVSRIVEFRERAGLTQIELANRLGVTENTIANWEKGRSGLVWIERVIELCNTLQCRPDQLICYVPDTEPKKSNTNKREKVARLRKSIDTLKSVSIDNQQNFNSQKVEAND